MSSYRMTTNAPTMPELIDRLDALANAYIDGIIEVGSLAVKVHAPRDRGHLVAWLSQNRREGSGVNAWGWVGPLTGLDIDVSVKGRGYLKQFVQDAGLGFKPTWKSLSDAERDQLQEGRESGNEAWGGKVINAMYAPRYMAAIDRGLVPGTQKNIGFIQRILDQTERMAKAANRTLPTGMAGVVRTDYA